jgi:hypothetical protein
MCGHGDPFAIGSHSSLLVLCANKDGHSLGNSKNATSVDKLILPDGQITFVFSEMACPAPFAKIFSFAADPNHFYIPHRLVPTRGADRASSRTRGGMRWTQGRQARKAIAGRDEPRERVCGVQDDRRLSGRQSRVVPTPVAGAKLAEAKSSSTGFDQP